MQQVPVRDTIAHGGRGSLLRVAVAVPDGSWVGLRRRRFPGHRVLPNVSGCCRAGRAAVEDEPAV
eukprot:1785439-Alexandrium_andersonii.AAC.1